MTVSAKAHLGSYWPYHEDGNGAWIPCDDNPCTLHGDSDVIARSPGEAYQRAYEAQTPDGEYDVDILDYIWYDKDDDYVPPAWYKHASGKDINGVHVRILYKDDSILEGRVGADGRVNGRQVFDMTGEGDHAKVAGKDTNISLIIKLWDERYWKQIEGMPEQGDAVIIDGTAYPVCDVRPIAGEEDGYEIVSSEENWESGDLETVSFSLDQVSCVIRRRMGVLPPDAEGLYKGADDNFWVYDRFGTLTRIGSVGGTFLAQTVKNTDTINPDAYPFNKLSYKTLYRLK